MASCGAVKVVSVWVIVLLVFPWVAAGAILEGVVYDYTLSRVDQAVIEIATDPVQRQVTVGGRYRFELLPGNYSLRAQGFRRGMMVSNASQMISIRGEGRFTVDLILDPVLEIDEDLSDDGGDLNLSDVFGSESRGGRMFGKDEWPLSGIAGVVLGVVIVGVVLLIRAGFVWRKRMADLPSPNGGSGGEFPAVEAEKDSQGIGEKETAVSPISSDLEGVLKLLQEQGGRSTQKEIRKLVPFSEAKVSLMIAELEHEGWITKIKKGRGNIIILKKKVLNEKKSGLDGVKDSFK